MKPWLEVGAFVFTVLLLSLVFGVLALAIARGSRGRRPLGAVLLLGIVSLLASVPGARAADPLAKYFALSGTLWGVSNAWAIIPPVSDQVAVIEALQCSSDLFDNRVTIFTNGTRSVVFADSSGTNIHVNADGTNYGGTNGFAAGDILIVCTPGVNGCSQRLRVHSVGTTNVTVTTAPGVTLAAGSSIYRVGTNQVIKGMTNATTGIFNSRISYGQPGQPVLIDCSGTSSAFINLLSGAYK